MNHFESVGNVCRLAPRLRFRSLIVRRLHTIVRAEIILNTNPTVKEKLIYAIGLTRINAFSGARKLLEALDGQSKLLRPEERLSGLIRTYLLQVNCSDHVLDRHDKCRSGAGFFQLTGRDDRLKDHVHNF